MQIVITFTHANSDARPVTLTNAKVAYWYVRSMLNLWTGASVHLDTTHNGETESADYTDRDAVSRYLTELAAL